MSTTILPLRLPSRTGDVVGVTLDTASGTSAALLTFGQGFAAGAVRPDAALLLRTEAGSAAAQMDVKTTHTDGSVATAVLTIAAPAIPAGGVVQGILSIASSTPAAPAIDLLHALAGYDLSVDMRIENPAGGGTTVNLDLAGAMRDALAAGKASFWTKGALAAEARVDLKVSGSFHVTLDLTAHADGRIEAGLGFNNDLAMGSSGGTVRYAATVIENGNVVHRTGDLTQYQYQNHHVTLGEVAAPNLRHDVAYLQAAGFVPDFDFSGGVSNGVVSAMKATMGAGNWDAPFAPNGIFQYMPNTGGRADIGPTTQANWAWLANQDATTRAYALGQADAADGIPWHFRDVKTGTWITTDNHPKLWTDGRGGDGNTTGLTQKADGNNNGWTIDTAHQPSLSGIPFLLTGERRYLDELNAQAAYDIVSVWSEPRGNDQNLLLPADQIRGAAWSLRELGLAAQLNPDGSPEKAYFKAAVEKNWSWLVDQIPAWTAQEGEVHGRLMADYADGWSMAPWQEDFFAIVAAEEAMRGNADAKTFLEWQSNWIVGRFLHAADGFHPHDGITYNVARRGDDGQILTTWKAIGEQTVKWGQSNGDGWAQSHGYYGQVAAAALAGVITVTGSTEAMKAYAWLMNSGAPWVHGGADSQLDMAPQMRDGSMITSDHVLVAAANAVTKGTATADLIQGVGGNERLEGGGGDDILVAGGGRDILLGGAGDDVLFGGSGTATLAGGSGRNHLEAGSGATVFAFKVAEAAADTVKGYRAGVDTIRLLDANGADVSARAASPILAAATTDAAGNTVLRLSAGHDVTVLGVAKGAIRIGTGTVLDLGDGTAPPPPPSASPPPPPPPPPPAGPGVLTLHLSEDAWQGHAEFAVTVDGVQLGGARTVTASRDAGRTEAFAFEGLSSAAHKVEVRFLNNAWGGNAIADRNLYVDGVTFGGAYKAVGAALMSGGDVATFDIAPKALPVPPAGTLALRVSEDAWNGHAEFAVLVDGKQVGGTYAASASHAAGRTTDVLLAGIAPGAHKVEVRFLNDDWGGTAATDRNLYVEGVTYDGTYKGIGAALMSGTDVATFDVRPAVLPIPIPTPPATADLALRLSEDAWNGHAEFIVKVDGQQVGGTRGVTASHATGQTQDVVLPGLSSTAHKVEVIFTNDDWGGHAGADRNLYVEGVTFGGVHKAIGAALKRGGDTASFDVSAPPVVPVPPPVSPGTLTLRLSEDAFQGDAQYTVKVDGQQVGGVRTVTASHAAGRTEDVTLTGLSNTAHDVEVTFLNDAWGGSATADRNLYVEGVTFGGIYKVIGAELERSGDKAVFKVAPASPAPTAGTLALRVSEDAWNGHAEFAVLVDGKQVGGTYAASASHAAGQTADLVLNGITAGPHRVEVKFLNDAWGGSPDTDRNLYVEGVTYGGSYREIDAALMRGGDVAAFEVGAGIIPAVADPVW